MRRSTLLKKCLWLGEKLVVWRIAEVEDEIVEVFVDNDTLIDVMVKDIDVCIENQFE